MKPIRGGPDISTFGDAGAAAGTCGESAATAVPATRAIRMGYNNGRTITIMGRAYPAAGYAFACFSARGPITGSTTR